VIIFTFLKKLTEAKKINLLVIPDLFPKDDGDMQGIFVIDYLKAVQPYCTISILVARLYGKKKGLTIEKTDHGTLYRYCVSASRPSSFLKPFLYIKWFWRGYQVGKSTKGIDIIHAHGTILSGTLSWLLARKKRIPFIITEHVGPFTAVSNSLWKKNWTKRIMQKANAVLTVSEHQKKEILSCGISPKKIMVTNNPVDTELFKLPEKNTSKNKNMLFAGRLDHFKGASRCVLAFARIAASYPDWKLVIIGDGEDYLLIMEFIKKNPLLASQIILKGQLSKTEISVEMRTAAFFVFPSRHESFGLVVAEALSSGLPVITTHKTAPPEFVTPACGLLVDPNNTEEIARAMEHLVHHYASYDPGAIRKIAKGRFSFENFGKKLSNIYLAELNKG